jgi:1,4-alpha-glucan branching enzyme
MLSMQPLDFEAHFYDQLLRIVDGQHHQPHAILGLHPFFEGGKVIRLWRPGAQQIYLEVFGSLVEARKIHDAGIFEFVVPPYTTPTDYRVFHQN